MIPPPRPPRLPLPRRMDSHPPLTLINPLTARVTPLTNTRTNLRASDQLYLLISLRLREDPTETTLRVQCRVHQNYDDPLLIPITTMPNPPTVPLKQLELLATTMPVSRLLLINLPHRPSRPALWITRRLFDSHLDQ